MRYFLAFLEAAMVFAALAGPLGVAPAAAQYTPVQWSTGNGNLVPLERVFAMLRQRYPGDPIGNVAKQAGPAGVPLYEVKWLTDTGRKMVFLVNARTGGVVSTRGAN